MSSEYVLLKMVLPKLIHNYNRGKWDNTACDACTKYIENVELHFGRYLIADRGTTLRMNLLEQYLHEE